jgi:AcrR family transcriptional regulator
MPQVLKSSVRARIEDAALRSFARHGYDGTSMAMIAAAAETAPANLYRYYSSKETLFDAVVPADLARRHDALLDTRITALAEGGTAEAATAAGLLDFWAEHRLAVVVLLDKAEGTRFADYPDAFVERLTGHARQAMTTAPSRDQLEIVRLVFDNTRSAIARILATGQDREQIRALITAFWSYQVPGLRGLLAFLNSDTGDGPAPHEAAPPPHRG